LRAKPGNIPLFLSRFTSPVLALVLALLPVSARGQTTAPSATGFELHEWSIFVLDASQNRLNPDGFVSSTLPQFIESRRQAATAGKQDAPSPVGIIRLVGSADSKVDVRLEIADGEFLSNWPKAQKRSKQLLWRDLALSDKPGTDPLPSAAPTNWFGSLRDTPSDYLAQSDGPAERFILFDVDLPYTCPVKVTRGGDRSAEVKNISNVTLHSVRFYQPDNGQWRQTILGNLPVVKPTTQPGTTQPTTAQPATTQSATTQATTMPLAATSPATQPATLIADWLPAFKKAAVSDQDCELISRILTREAFDARRLTVVYLLDSAEYDRLFPLEVVPEPNKIVRLGIVIIKNADPAVGTEIDDLIVQLGDPTWAKREEASQSLLKMGAAAVPKLQEATKNKDLEVVWRAEKLVAQLKTGTPQPNQ